VGGIGRGRDVSLGRLRRLRHDLSVIGRVPALEHGAVGGIAPLAADAVLDGAHSPYSHFE
jgi:hypothetical protein